MADPVWLAAQYHFPATYSCRMPLSSMSSVQATPGPGPATIRLALIRAGCEIYGRSYVQEELFPIIRAAAVRVRPPERVAISQQCLRVYKARHDQPLTAESLVESLQDREVAQAQGMLTVYLQVPATHAGNFRELLWSIGYWGQTDSLTMCWEVEDAVPDQDECACPLRILREEVRLGGFFVCVLADFRTPMLAWEDVMPDEQAGERDPLQREVYVWPMHQVSRNAGGKILIRQQFSRIQAQNKGEQKKIPDEKRGWGCAPNHGEMGGR